MDRENVKQTVIEIISTILGLTEEEVSCERNLQDYGLDSIVGVELVGKLNQVYGLNLHKTAVYAYPTINAFVDYIVDESKQCETAEDNYNNDALGRYGRKVGEEGSVTATYNTSPVRNVVDQEKIQEMIQLLSEKYGDIDEAVYKGCTDLDELAQRVSDYLNLRDDFAAEKK